MENNEIIERLDAMQQAINQTQSFALLAAKAMLNINDVALLTGLSKAHVYRLTCNHVLPYYKPNGKQIYFKRQDVEMWMQTNRVNSVGDAEAMAARYCVTGSAQKPATK